MEDQGGPCQFEVFVRLERRCDHRYLRHEEVFQVCIRNVAGRDQQKLVRSVEQQKGVHEIRVFGYHDAEITGGQFVNLRIGGAIAVWQVQSVDRVVTRLTQPVRQTAGKLRVNQEVQIRTGSVRLTWLNLVA